MITKPEEYRYVTGGDMNLVKFDGGIMPLRDEPRILRGEDVCFLIEAYKTRANAIKAVRFPMADSLAFFPKAEWQDYSDYNTDTHEFTRRLDREQALLATEKIKTVMDREGGYLNTIHAYDGSAREYATDRELQFINYRFHRMFGTFGSANSDEDIQSVRDGFVRQNPIEHAFSDVWNLSDPMVSAFEINYSGSFTDDDPEPRSHYIKTLTSNVESVVQGDHFYTRSPWGYRMENYSAYNGGYQSFYVPADEVFAQYDAPGADSAEVWGVFRVYYNYTYGTLEEHTYCAFVDLSEYMTRNGDIFSVKLPSSADFVRKVAGLCDAWLAPLRPSAVGEACYFTLTLEDVTFIAHLDDRTKWSQGN